MSAPRKRRRTSDTRRRTPSANTISIRASEKKVHPANINLAPTSGACLMTPLNEVTASGIPNSRIGSQIKMLGMYLRLVFRPSSTDENNVIRVVVAMSKGPPLVAADGPGAYDYQPDRTKYHVLDDFTLCGSLNNANNGVTPVFYKNYYKLGGKKAYFTASAGNTITGGHIVLFARSDSAAAPNPTIDGFSELVFCE